MPTPTPLTHTHHHRHRSHTQTAPHLPPPRLQRRHHPGALHALGAAGRLLPLRARAQRGGRLDGRVGAWPCQPDEGGFDCAPPARARPRGPRAPGLDGSFAWYAHMCLPWCVRSSRPRLRSCTGGPRWPRRLAVSSWRDTRCYPTSTRREWWREALLRPRPWDVRRFCVELCRLQEWFAFPSSNPALVRACVRACVFVLCVSCSFHDAATAMTAVARPLWWDFHDDPEAYKASLLSPCV
jgi:hypothetical protein